MPMTAQPISTPQIEIRNERPQDAEAVEALLDRAFGPGRFVKASERVREFAEFRPDLSFCAWEGGEITGTVRLWRIAVGGRPPLAFLGPLAVEAGARRGGLGGELVERACRAAQEAGLAAVLLVGDEPYFSRFGFAAALAREITLPGPVDQRRVLLRELAPGGAEGLSGHVAAP